MNKYFKLFYKYVMVGGARAQFILAGLLIIAQIIVIIIDSAGSIVGLRSPFQGGGNEIVQLQMGLIAAFSLAYTWILGGHVRIELIIDRLGARGQFFINMLSAFFGMVYCVLVAIGIYEEAMDTQMLMIRTDMLRIQIAPVMFLFSLSFAHFALLLFFEFIRNCLGLIRGTDSMNYMSALQVTHLD